MYVKQIKRSKKTQTDTDRHRQTQTDTDRHRQKYAPHQHYPRDLTLMRSYDLAFQQNNIARQFCRKIWLKISFVCLPVFACYCRPVSVPISRLPQNTDLIANSIPAFVSKSAFLFLSSLKTGEVVLKFSKSFKQNQFQRLLYDYLFFCDVARSIAYPS